MTKTKFVTALAAGLLALPMAASAAIVTQLIHFDDAGNGWKWYSDVDKNFLFNPTNFQSSNQCADSTNGGNGSCVIEGNQGVLPLMTRPTNGPQSQGSASPQDPPQVSGAEKFTLDSFYFLLTGNGTGAENAITVTGSNSTSFTFQLGGNYDGLPSPPDVRFYEGPGEGNLAGDLVKLTGYVVTFGNLFKDVTSIQFSAPRTAQVRLDCVVATFDGSTTQPLSGFTQGCGFGDSGPPPTDLPEPGTLGLLSLALLGLGFAGRRRVN